MVKIWTSNSWGHLTQGIHDLGRISYTSVQRYLHPDRQWLFKMFCAEVEQGSIHPRSVDFLKGTHNAPKPKKWWQPSRQLSNATKIGYMPSDKSFQFVDTLCSLIRFLQRNKWHPLTHCSFLQCCLHKADHIVYKLSHFLCEESKNYTCIRMLWTMTNFKFSCVAVEFENKWKSDLPIIHRKNAGQDCPLKVVLIHDPNGFCDTSFVWF